MMPLVGWKTKLGSTSLSTRTSSKRAKTSDVLRSLKCFVNVLLVSTAPQSMRSDEHVRNGYLPMPPILIVCDLSPTTVHTHCATKTDASLGIKVTSMLACWRGCTVPLVGFSVNGASQLRLNSMGSSPSLVTWKERVSTSFTGQKPKSRCVGTWHATVGIIARMGTTNEPVSVVNSMTSSYGSSSCGRKLTSTVFDKPALSMIFSGKAMLKNLLSGSLYLTVTACLDTFLTVSVFVYSPPGTQVGCQTRPSPQSTPKRRMRSARDSGAGLSARSDLTNEDALPAGHEAGSPPRPTGLMAGILALAAQRVNGFRTVKNDKRWRLIGHIVT